MYGGLRDPSIGRDTVTVGNEYRVIVVLVVVVVVGTHRCQPCGNSIMRSELPNGPWGKCWNTHTYTHISNNLLQQNRGGEYNSECAYRLWESEEQTTDPPPPQTSSQPMTAACAGLTGNLLIMCWLLPWNQFLFQQATAYHFCYSQIPLW